MIQNFFKQISKIITFFWAYRWGSAGVFALTLTFSILEGIGISTVIPLFNKLSQQEPSDSLAARTIRQGLEFLQLDDRLLYVILAIIGIFLLKGVFQLASKYSRAHLQYSFGRDIKDLFFRKLFASDWESFIEFKRGHLLNEIISQSKNARMVFLTSLRTMVNFTMTAVFLCVSVSISWEFTLMALLLVGVILVLFSPLIRKAKTVGKDSVDAEQDLSSLFDEYITGYKLIKSYDVFDPAYENFTSETQKWFVSKTLVRLIRYCSLVAGELLVISSIFMFLYVGVTYFQIRVEEIGAISLLMIRVYSKANPVSDFQKIAQNLPSLDVLSARIQELDTSEQRRTEGGEEPSFQQEIRFSNVCFAYQQHREQDREYILRNINVTIEKGQMIGFAGGSGAGKSTLIDLLLGFLTPNDGQITIDGTRLDQLDLQQWRTMIGYVPQDGFLLDGTVTENIRFFRDLDQDTIRDAAKKANAHQFIRKFDRGYKTNVGESGVKLSGGQRQRISLARALAGRPEVLVLDEATSELDTNSERKIQQALEQLKHDVTILSIAHRISTILDSDQVIVLQNGEVVEQGDPAELLDQDSNFRDLYEQHEKAPG